jgi:pimeloyl-ACP methyl ester carboxylesterase
MGDPMTTVNANEVAIGIESFGDDDAAPLVLLAGGTTMLSWPDPLCERLATGGRRVVRYDLRDSGAFDDGRPGSARLHAARPRRRRCGPRRRARRPARAPGGDRVGGMVAQVAALDHPGRFSALTLAGTRAVAPGKPDADLPNHDKATMKRLFTRPMPDWTDREVVAEFAAAGAQILGDDPVAARAIAARIWDRTPGTAPPVQMANQLGMVFSKLNCKPAGVSAYPRSSSPRSWSTAAATGSSPSATARRAPARSPERGCPSSRRPPLPSPMRRPARSPGRCSHSGS